MTSAKDIIDQLRLDMEDAADDVRLMEFIRKLGAAAQSMAMRDGIDPKTTAYALAGVACAMCDMVRDREPVLVALTRYWPDVFLEVSAEEAERLRNAPERLR